MNIKRYTANGILFLLLILVGGIWAFARFQDKEGNTEIGRTTEKELNVVLSTSVGSISIARGQEQKVLSIESTSQRKKDGDVDLSYTIRNRVGYLDLALGESGDHESGHFKIKGFKEGAWQLHFSEALPVSFELELGFGSADIDLSGLQVRDFSLTTGASDVMLTFDTPNEVLLDHVNIETGLSKFDGRNLGNGNFKYFRFEGGVGTYTLDFSGALRREVDVDIHLGFGVLTLIVPSDVGARVITNDNWFSHVECDKGFQSTGKEQFETENFARAEGKMNIRIETGLGRVKLKHR